MWTDQCQGKRGREQMGRADLSANHDFITSITLPVPFVSIVPSWSGLAILLAFSHMYLVIPFSTWSSSSDPGLTTTNTQGKA